MNSKILKALSNVGVPVRFQHYEGTEETYITFFIYNDKTEINADDKDIITGYSIQVDVWSKTDYTKLVEKVHRSMIENDFMKDNFYDLYEDDTKTYHKAMRFYINKEVI